MYIDFAKQILVLFGNDETTYVSWWLVTFPRNLSHGFLRPQQSNQMGDTNIIHPPSTFLSGKVSSLVSRLAIQSLGQGSLGADLWSWNDDDTGTLRYRDTRYWGKGSFALHLAYTVKILYLEICEKWITPYLYQFIFDTTLEPRNSKYIFPNMEFKMMII